MVPLHFTTSTAAVALTLAGNWSELYGVSATDSKDATYYVKIWWQGSSLTLPVIGTTKPNATFQIASGVQNCILPTPAVLSGPMFYAVTLNAADTDTTVLATGGDVITLWVG